LGFAALVSLRAKRGNLMPHREIVSADFVSLAMTKRGRMPCNDLATILVIYILGFDIV
jgi:hypothetical protein